MASPQILEDLKKFGFNIYNAANNHSMDYSHNGLEATIRHLKEHDIRFAGIGMNLADAAAPVYLECRQGRAALIAATATFHEAWAAGSQRMDTVSYTHLDVYKRQSKSRRCHKGKGKEPELT